jgi:hypothetical protein
MPVGEANFGFVVFLLMQQCRRRVNGFQFIPLRSLEALSQRGFTHQPTPCDISRNHVCSCAMKISPAMLLQSVGSALRLSFASPFRDFEASTDGVSGKSIHRNYARSTSDTFRETELAWYNDVALCKRDGCT